MSKKIIIILISAVLLITSGIVFSIKDENERIAKEKLKEAEEKKLAEIENSFSSYMKTEKEVSLYTDKFKKIGTVSKDIVFNLEKVVGEYYKIKDSNYYLSYQNLEKSSEEVIDRRYLNYIPFNYKLKISGENSFYNEDESLFAKINLNEEFDVIYEDGLYYGVIYFDRLLYLKKDGNYEKIVTTLVSSASKVAVLNYHFIYLTKEVCGEIICHSEEQIRSHFDYLKENNYYTLTTEELEMFIKGYINLPVNSILLTIDDGARAFKFIPILEEYKINATLFLVTSWYSTDLFKSNYLELASHSDNLHTVGVCNSGQGGGINCLDSETIQKDLKTSREKLNNTQAFCFPFYEYSDYSINELKKAGFTRAFIGDNKFVTKNTNPYKIPRFIMYNTTSKNALARILSA